MPVEAPHGAVVVFQAGGAWLALPVEQVEEVSDSDQLTPLPRAPAHVPALLNLHGSAIPLLDIAVFLGLRTQRGVLGDAGGYRRTLVVNAAGFRVGVICDRVGGVIPFRGGDQGRIQVSDNDRLRRFSRAELDFDDRIVTLLALDKLLESARVP